jgi:hypothetical protein
MFPRLAEAPAITLRMARALHFHSLNSSIVKSIRQHHLLSARLRLYARDAAARPPQLLDLG